MAILRGLRYRAVADYGDPDDYRPNSRIALAADLGDDSGRLAQSLSFIFEVVGPGDSGALHRHPVDEAIFIEDGELEVRIGEQVDVIRPGDVAFVPKDAPHAWRNVGDRPLNLRAVFPSDIIALEMLERTPAPGTESDPPQPPYWFDVREALRGE